MAEREIRTIDGRPSGVYRLEMDRDRLRMPDDHAGIYIMAYSPNGRLMEADICELDEDSLQTVYNEAKRLMGR